MAKGSEDKGKAKFNEIIIFRLCPTATYFISQKVCFEHHWKYTRGGRQGKIDTCRIRTCAPEGTALAGQRVNHSAKVSSTYQVREAVYQIYSKKFLSSYVEAMC